MIKKRIFIACEDVRLRIAMLLLLDNEPGIVVAGITDRLPGLVTQLEATQAELLLLEWKIPPKSLLDLLTDVHNLESSTKVFVLSGRSEEKDGILAAGADYFILKDAPPDELLAILHGMIYV